VRGLTLRTLENAFLALLAAELAWLGSFIAWAGAS
jgi:hypothetical protein